MISVRRALALLLALAGVLRVALVCGGGQGYWPDENRYFKGLGLLLAAAGGREALRWVFASPDHTGFTFLGATLGCLHWVLLGAAGLPPEPELLGASAWIPALPLAAASVVVIALVFALAERAGAGPGEALAAAALAAGSSSLFYWSRHLQPYDAALALDLAALWLALDRRPSAGRSSACGLLAGLGFLTYNRYWASAALVGVVHVLVGTGGTAQRARRALWFGTALCAPVALLTALGAALGEPPFVLAMAGLLELTAVEADFSEGWWVPWAYLWHAEHGLLAVWLLGAGAAAAGAAAPGAPERGRAALWLACLGGLYASFVLFSNGLELIGVLGRQVRQLVPFLCLAAAVPTARLARALAGAPAGRALAALAALGLLGQVAWNFAAPLGQEFPDRFRRRVAERHGDVPRGVSLVGPRIRRPAFAGVLPDTPPPGSAGRPAAPGLRLLNAQHLYPVRRQRADLPGRVVLRARHPLQYLPNHYEGFRPAERRVLRTSDVSMRLVETTAGGRRGQASGRPGTPRRGFSPESSVR